MADEPAHRGTVHQISAVAAETDSEYLAEVSATARTRDYLLGRAADAYAELVTNIEGNYDTRMRLALGRRSARLAEPGTHT